MFNDSVMERIEAAADGEGAVTTTAARELLGFAEQRWLRLSRLEGFPRTPRRGQTYRLNAAALVAFLRLRNFVEAGVTLTQWAACTRHTRKYIAAQLRKHRAPGAIGYVNGRPRYDLYAALRWWEHDQRGEVCHYPPRIGPPEVPADWRPWNTLAAVKRADPAALCHELGHRWLDTKAKKKKTVTSAMNRKTGHKR